MQRPFSRLWISLSTRLFLFRMSNCCTYVFKVLFWFVLFILKKALGLDLRSLFVIGNGSSSSHLFKCKDSRVLHENILFNCEAWNAILKYNYAPVRVNYGSIDSFEILFGWFLFGKIRVRIKGINILLTTTRELKYNHELEIKRSVQYKRFLVRTLEKLHGRHQVLESLDAKEYSWIARIVLRLVLLIVKRIKIDIEEFHLRVEEKGMISQEMTSLGLIAKRFELHENETPSDRFSSSKQLKVTLFSTYWNPSDQALITDLQDNVDKKEKLRITNYYKLFGHCYVLHPCSPSMHLVIAPGTDTLLKANVHCKLDSIAVYVSRSQLRVATALFGHIKHLQNMIMFLKHRPEYSVHRNAREWWRYAFQCISIARKQTSLWSWLEVKEESNIKAKYAACYRRFLSKIGFKEKLRNELKALEDELSVVGVIVTRRKVEREKGLKPNRQKAKQMALAMSMDTSVYSLSGKCDTNSIELSLLMDGGDLQSQSIDSEEIDIFTLKVSSSHLSLEKGQHESSITVSVTDALCLGVEENNERVNILVCDTSTTCGDRYGDNVLFLKLCWLNSSEPSYTKSSHYNYHISTHSKPSIIHFHWNTFKKLAEFGAAVRGTHKDLQDAVKAQVKAVGRESKRKFRHFIANKEQASLDADINLPTIVFNTPNSTCRQLGCHFGKLNIHTSDEDKVVADNSCAILYKVLLQDLKLYMSLEEITIPKLGVERDSVFDLKTVTSEVIYTTSNYSFVPSNLSSKVYCPEVSLGLKDGEIETIFWFCYNQFDKFIDTFASGDDSKTDKKMKSSSLIPPSPAAAQPNFISINTQSDIFKQIVEEEDFSSQEDYKVFECETTIDLIKVVLTDKGPDLLFTVNETCASCLLREQATEVTAKISSIQFTDHTQTDEQDRSIDLISTEPGFLNFIGTFIDQDASLFATQYLSIEEYYELELKPLTLSLHYECLCNVLSWLSELHLPPFWLLLSKWNKGYEASDNWNKPPGEADSELYPSGSTGDAIHRLCCIKLDKARVTLDTVSTSSLLAVNLQDVDLKYSDLYDKGTKFSLRFEYFSITDGLIVYDSPYHQAIVVKNEETTKDGSNLKILYMKGSSVKVDIVINLLKIIYLHKLIQTLQVLAKDFSKRVVLSMAVCSNKLQKPSRINSATAHRSTSSLSNDGGMVCIVDVSVNKLSFKLPRDSYHPDALTVKARKLDVVFSGFEKRDNEQADKTNSKYSREGLRASATSIELNWNYGSMKSTIATTNTFFIDRESDCWTVGFDRVKVFLTGEVLASVPGVVVSNFSEKEPYASIIIDKLCESKSPSPSSLSPLTDDDDDDDDDANEASSIRKKRPNLGRMRKRPALADGERFDPLLKLEIQEWELRLQNLEGISKTTIAVVNLSGCTLMAGNVMSISNGDIDRGVAVKAFVNSISGVEGVITDARQKIFTKYSSSEEGNSQTSILDIYIKSIPGRQNEVTIGFSNMCFCLWPAFTHALLKFKKQIKLKQGKRGKWWKSRRRSTVASLAFEFGSSSRSSKSMSQTDNSSSPGLIIRIGLESCYIAILENPSSFEVTTPGAVLQLMSSEDGSKRGLFQFEYNYSSPQCWYVDLSSCWFHGNLCLFGENIIPLTKVLPPSYLTLSYNVSDSHQKLSLSIPTIECHITNELYEVFNNFYTTYTKQNLSSSTVLNPSVVSDDIWSIKDFNRASVLPELPELDLFDEPDGGPDDESSDEESVLEESLRSNEFQAGHPKQEAYIDLNDVTINFDLSSGDSDSVPVICLHTTTHCVVNNWSTQVNANVDLTLESFIYNERRGLWEPLLEPINSSIGTYDPYTVNIKLIQAFDLLPGESIFTGSPLPKSTSSGSLDQKDGGSAVSDSPKSVRSLKFGGVSNNPTASLPATLVPPPPSSPLPRTKKSAQSLRTSRNRLDASFDAKDNVSLKSIEEPENHSTYMLLVTSEERLEFTLSPSALKTLNMYSVMLTADYTQAMENIRNCVQDSRPPVRIENKTGISITVYPGSTFKEGDSNFEKPFKFRTHALKHFPSRIETGSFESTDGSLLSHRSSGLSSISEDSSFALKGLSSPARIKLSRSRMSSTESEKGIAFHTKTMYDTCPVNVNEDTASYCEDIDDSDNLDDLKYLESSLCSLQGSFIPVIDSNINSNFEDDNDDSDSEEIDSVSSLTSRDSRRNMKRAEFKKQRRKSVCQLQLMGTRTCIDINPGGATLGRTASGDSASGGATAVDTPTGIDTAGIKSTTATKSTTSTKSATSTKSTTDRSDYWRPKLLRKTHRIKIECYSSSKSSAIPVALPGVFAAPVVHEEYGQVALICDVSFKRGVRKVLIRSGLQIRNNLPFQLAVYSFNELPWEIEKIGEIGRNDDLFEVPFSVTADKNVALKFGAGNDGVPCREVIHWKALVSSETRSMVITCPQNSSKDGNMYYFQASIKMVPAVNITVHSPSHIITLEPAFIIYNHLPFPMDMVLEALDHSTISTVSSSRDRISLTSIEECETESILDSPPTGDYSLKFTFEYNGVLWSGKNTICVRKPFQQTVKFVAFDKTNHKNEAKMYLNFRASEDSPHIVDIYSLYWIVNKTGLDLEIEHQPGKTRIQNAFKASSDLPLVLTYKPSKFNEQQHKLRVRVINGDWSKSIMLGAVGKTINVVSTSKDISYEFAIETRLLKSTLTEMVYIMPKYSIMNYTDVSLLCSSVGINGVPLKDTAVMLQPQENLEPFWPGKHTVVNLSLVEDQPSSPQSPTYRFSLDILTPTVIKTDHTSIPIITVKVQPDPIRSTTLISIRPEVNVGTMLKIQNLCRCNCVKFMQKLTSGAGQLYPLEPNQSILYTWDCPVGSREINWQIDGAIETSWRTIKFDKPKQNGSTGVVTEDRDGNKQETRIMWTSMFEGSQLVLRFLDNNDDYKHLMKLRTRFSPDKIQFFCSLEGVGVSLVDNAPKEIAYFSILSSPVIWTRKRPTKSAVWSVISKEHSEQLEAALRLRQATIVINEEQYDLETMTIDSAKGGEICRSFNPGVWVWYSQCDNRQLFNLKLGRLQIDNQLSDNELHTTVVFSEDSRQTGNTEEVGVPFLNLEVSISNHGRNEIREYEKVLLNVKPCQLNIELRLIAALLPFADTSFAASDKKQKTDMERLDTPLAHLLNAKTLLTVRTLNYVDALQINQTSVFVTYTTAGEYDLSSEWGKVVNAIVHFALITKGSFNIGLKSVQVSNEITNVTQLKRILYGHYKNEVFWQFQQFALGLDVIGNPAKLFNSFQTGAKELVFKYKEGTMEGETGHGIALGVKSLLGHVVGGGANSVVSSTGTLSSMLLAATDLDYQRKHRHMRRAQDSKGQLFLAGKFFLKGMFHGTTDIFVKPATGAVQDGLEGFLKGLGRGTVSILVKPTLGIVDLAKYTMESVRSAVDDETEVQNVRRPRVLYVDKEIHPYNDHEAEGLYILSHLPQVLSDELYKGHCWQQSSTDQKTSMVIMVTSKRLLQLYKADKKYCVNWWTNIENIHKVQATEYCDEDNPDEKKPGLFLKGIFNKSGKKAQHRVLHMENEKDVKSMKEKLQLAIKDTASTSSQ